MSLAEPIRVKEYLSNVKLLKYIMYYTYNSISEALYNSIAEALNIDNL